jgi:hypothetical protein
LSAPEIAALDPLARTKNGDDDRCTTSPTEARYLATPALSARLGANRLANWPLASQCL